MRKMVFAFAVGALMGYFAHVELNAQGKQKKSQVGNFVTMFHIEVEQDEEGFIQRFRKRQKFVDKMKGFVGMWVLQDKEDKKHFIVMSEWASDEDHAAWTKSEEFKKSHASPHPHAKPQKLDKFTVVAK